MATGEHIPSENTALSPSFGHLPLDVLLPIVKMLTWEPLLDEPCADVLLVLIAVDSHLRRVLLSIPSLWTRISSDWSEELQLIFLAQSGSTRLHLYFGVSEYAFGIDVYTAQAVVNINHPALAGMKHLLAWTSRTASITFRVQVAAQCQLFFDALNKGAPVLHTLHVQNERGASAPVWSVIPLQPRACPQLSYLLAHTDLQGFPTIPSLRSLELGGCGTGHLVAVQHALKCSPQLESIVIECHNAAIVRRSATPHLDVMPMPHLHLLRISSGGHPESVRDLLDVLNMLPDPSTHLEVGIALAAWAGVENEAVLARLGQYWRRHIGHNGVAWLPPVTSAVKLSCLPVGLHSPASCTKPGAG
jgi:hypothetical protein